MPHLKLTKNAVEDIPFPESGQSYYRDTQLQGFGLRVSRSTKSYFVEKRVRGKTTRHTLGIHGQITCEQARKLAQKALGEMTLGRNPNTER